MTIIELASILMKLVSLMLPSAPVKHGRLEKLSVLYEKIILHFEWRVLPNRLSHCYSRFD